ncbi:4Fe-4S dicluster domain-containing protein [Azoarcus sp. KH32C]|uniref:4Fe-4S dicluster domain-containing protein n=1 Tax=Azoarcus sp. KH32C TaxID=748247 RepID=UPI0002385CD7|nr:4Fe-4S dicluster domain-containing protein [Azoarcus sp. KH32C]BAL26941.1 hypothetical protein AZKH_p0058 [Azoarcus sp. KH32C]
MSIAYPQFHASRCTRYRFRYSECNRCEEACPHAAITLSDEGARLDPTRCQNCALCVSACRTAAWQAETFKPIELLRQAIRQETFSFACAPSGLAADAVVPCLGAIDAVTLAYLAKRHIPVTLHGAGQCTGCTHAPRGAEQLALNLEGCKVLMAAAAPQDSAWALPTVANDAAPERIRARPDFVAGRRQLFRRLLGRGMDEVAQSAAAIEVSRPIVDKAIRASAYVLPEQRELLQIVCNTRDGQACDVPLHDALPLMGLELRAGCSACEACFRVCPTGAIQIDESPAHWQLQFVADRCVGCQVCLEVCQPRVLDAEAAFDARPERPARILHTLSKQRCARCDRHFVSPRPEETCPICRDDEDAFDAIFG